MPEPRDTNPRDVQSDAEMTRLRWRYRRARLFKGCTILALVLAGGFLVAFLGDLVARGYSALWQAQVHATITLTPETVKDPQTAIAPELRDIVSRTRLRDLPREGTRVKLQLPVRFTAEVADDPEAALDDVTLQPDDFPVWQRREEPVTIPRKQVLNLVGETGLEQIRQRLAAEPGLVGQTEPMWLWGTPELSGFLQFGTDLTGEARATAELLEDAGRTRQAFNTLEFGEDGKTFDEWLVADADVDQYLKGYDRVNPAAYEDPSQSPISPAMAARIDQLRDEGTLELRFNTTFFTHGDSNAPEVAGILPAIIGSVLVLTLVLVICVPIGVLTSIYLEEFAPDNWFTQAIEVNINNLAAIPSILFGVLGLAAFISFVGMPRSSALVGGSVLALMTLPIVIISTRAALRAVPDSIRSAGYAMGATRWQVVTHHVLPQAVSGIMTGSIIGIAQAMGETAPLIIIGLIAFVPEIPGSLTDSTTVMPAQIFRWWSLPDPAYRERAALMILVLLAVLFVLNGLAVMIRARSEKQW